MKITLDMFNQIPAGDVFASGIAENNEQGLFMTTSDAGNLLLWVAKKGYANDWTMYCHWLGKGHDFVLNNGDKVFDRNNRDRVLKTDDEVNKLFRY